MDDAHFMQLAIDETRRGMAAGQSPFGACIVKDGRVVACAHNVVLRACDSTAHAEVTAIRQACAALRTVDLSGCTIYSTTEPCPMCFTAVHWARIGRIVYGTSIADAQRAGFGELPISNEKMKAEGGAAVALTPDVLRDACARLFADYTGPRY
jgi:tRNA(Arg) A34 adenosine deaminase TadA